MLNDGDASAGYNSRLHIATPPNSIPMDGEAHHYAVVVNLEQPSLRDKVQLFIDARPVQTVLVHEDGSSFYRTFTQESDLSVLIGARRTANGTTDVLSGLIDEVRVTANNLDVDDLLHIPDTRVLEWSLFE
jgi:hypothetical protein